MKPEKMYLRDYRKPEFLIDTVEIQFDIFSGHTIVTNTMEVRQNPEVEGAHSDLLLDGEKLELLSLKLNGEELPQSAYGITDQQLKIWNAPEKFQLQIQTKIFPEENNSCEGLYKSDHFYVTQNEAQGFRKITYFMDRPDVMSLYRTVITADQKALPVLLSNGNLIEQETLSDGRHRVVWEDPFKKPCYLYALVAGDMALVTDSFTTMSGREVELQIYCPWGSEDRCQYAMGALKRSMKWDEERFGLEYDLDIYMIVAVNSFNAGAMENKGLNVFNSSYVLANAETATDTDFANIEAIVGHEYFHNWTGNRITLRDWFQLSLKEGLTVFRDQEFTADLHSREVKRIEDVQLLRDRQFAEDAGPTAHPVRPEEAMSIDNFFSTTIYEKGAEVIRMLYVILGRQGFRRGMDKYVELFDGQAITTDDFVKAMELASGQDLSQFRLWYSQSGTPNLSVQGSYNQDQEVYTVKIVQSCPSTPGQPESTKKPFYIPLSMGLLGASGQPLSLNLDGEDLGKETTLIVNRQEQSFSFKGVKEKPVPSFLRDFSSPVKLNFEYSDQELSFLMAHETNAFTQWEAMQKMILRTLRQAVSALSAGESMDLPSHYSESYAQILSNEKMDPNYKALVLGVPSLNFILQSLGWENFDQICQARRWLFSELFKAHGSAFLAGYESLNTKKSYELSSVEVGRRSLKNRYLDFLLRSSQDHIGLAVQQFESADNMTDRMAAFSALLHQENLQSHQAKEHFYEEWKNDPLVFYKFLRAVAGSHFTDLEELKHLSELPEFSMGVPNCVYNLFYAFAGRNLEAFHAPGTGNYEFFVDLLVRRDRENPQVGARLASVFNSWRKLDAHRQSQIEPLLRKVIQTEKLSRNTYEVLSKGF